MEKESTNRTDRGMNGEYGLAVSMVCGVGVIAGVRRSVMGGDRRQHHHGVL